MQMKEAWTSVKMTSVSSLSSNLAIDQEAGVGWERKEKISSSLDTEFDVRD